MATCIRLKAINLSAAASTGAAAGVRSVGSDVAVHVFVHANASLFVYTSSMYTQELYIQDARDLYNSFVEGLTSLPNPLMFRLLLNFKRILMYLLSQ